MGKGGGCVPSKKKPSSIAADDSPTNAPPLPIDNNAAENAAALTTSPPFISKLKILIVFYSMYGHVEGLARRMKKGVDGVEGVEAALLRVPETLPPDALEQMRAPPKDDGIPEISSAAELTAADGVLFGFPTRYGCMAAQMKAFFDSTGQLWKEQKLAGKPAGFFVSTGTQGGGQETTALDIKHIYAFCSLDNALLSVMLLVVFACISSASGLGACACIACFGSVVGCVALGPVVLCSLFLSFVLVRVVLFVSQGWTAITQLAHHGMLFVPIGYTFGPGMFKMDSIRGGSPYGAGVFAGDGTRGPSDTELALAEHQGEYMAAIVKRKNWKGLKKTVLRGVKEDKGFTE
ncbi:hypothetical protein RHGRI_023538 [Rhododendron griersonianum]|uniref:NAD(P)H dehydrogenase (quinone) n=1 Tax=Rhododendron griersonianum TaxID=479676 RepID=A0AAV6J799_9ERIC|nr:hypothetical protein RHGRI_023538 [Rhododendron griersonianum]